MIVKSFRLSFKMSVVKGVIVCVSDEVRMLEFMIYFLKKGVLL